MIECFEVMMIWPGVYLVTAIMVDAPSEQLGIFGSVEDIDEPRQLIAEHRRQVHEEVNRASFSVVWCSEL